MRRPYSRADARGCGGRRGAWASPMRGASSSRPSPVSGRPARRATVCRARSGRAVGTSGTRPSRDRTSTRNGRAWRRRGGEPRRVAVTSPGRGWETAARRVGGTAGPPSALWFTGYVAGCGGNPGVAPSAVSSGAQPAAGGCEDRHPARLPQSDLESLTIIIRASDQRRDNPEVHPGRVEGFPRGRPRPRVRSPRHVHRIQLARIFRSPCWRDRHRSLAGVGC